MCTHLLLIVREQVQGLKHKLHMIGLLPGSHSLTFRCDLWASSAASVR